MRRSSRPACLGISSRSPSGSGGCTTRRSGFPRSDRPLPRQARGPTLRSPCGPADTPCRCRHSGGERRRQRRASTRLSDIWRPPPSISRGGFPSRSPSAKRATCRLPGGDPNASAGSATGRPSIPRLRRGRCPPRCGPPCRGAPRAWGRTTSHTISCTPAAAYAAMSSTIRSVAPVIGPSRSAPGRIGQRNTVGTSSGSRPRASHIRLQLAALRAQLRRSETGRRPEANRMPAVAQLRGAPKRAPGVSADQQGDAALLGPAWASSRCSSTGSSHPRTPAAPRSRGSGRCACTRRCARRAPRNGRGCRGRGTPPPTTRCPTPRKTRPPESASAVAQTLAVTTGLR